MFDLIALLYSNMYSYIDVMSDYILTGGISYMGNLSSTITLLKSSAAVIIQACITLWLFVKYCTYSSMNLRIILFVYIYKNPLSSSSPIKSHYIRNYQILPFRRMSIYISKLPINSIIWKINDVLIVGAIYEKISIGRCYFSSTCNIFL